MLVLGLEGTAWCASAAVYDTETDAVLQESDAYVPDSGGIHPREAAEHVADAIPSVVERVLDRLAERGWSADVDDENDDGTDGGSAPPVDAVAFSRGPGLGPCLRAVGTAARTLAGRWDVPLVGVNHMVAHLEIGRHRSGFDSPVCLNASGANAHLLGYRDGRYRVLGETMDTGVGNAIDKFTRHVGWSHPGGPKVEEAAGDGSYVDLPYVVKGMDFSFSGIMSAAKAEYDDGTPVEDVCYSLQEHVFAMLTEVSERALSLTGSDELVLGGGVGQNARLREMLAEMCDARGAKFHVPEPRFLRDNAGMIAVLGAKMYRAGDTVAIAESSVDPNFRPDQVPVTWRSREESVGVVDPEMRLRGAEAIVEIEGDRAVKRRIGKSYRHPELDRTLRTTRTRGEARLTSDARRVGVPTPLVYDVDVPEATLTLQYVGDVDLAERIEPEQCRRVGEHLARIHGAGFVHGDPTPRNVRVDDERTYLIDFGLGYYTDHVEDYAMDLHVFEGSVAGTTSDAQTLLDAFEEGYLEVGERRVIDRLRTVEGRGRYQVNDGP
ncbi:bifunctional N6-L-threonylcarbamoyladenine synthase/protein kinase Bud32 [Halalkaliarchaeum desulfuricum]|uniref:Probable bifunctional tRNA threonylcarbamoyladenosine biosynthesis protein n=1 Tax=Halalkaliarchaeum desulfuricum TaxID=2055893 RepID=A0A343TKL7_9EURY|nr:bifunctional N(6)-L-threonylcarbamoyladenine synthase/serine/threonine protein kinase [Halalkaliarchaeum desulfuricum]AUX09639.1 bifunctional N6-L-threonylcarbamoyladenine synthase/protein kinase Bud32 [Halalkaliarchaeum desulfuricum]